MSCLPFCVELAVSKRLLQRQGKARQVLLFLKEDALLPRLPSTSKNSGPPSTSASEVRASSSSAVAGKRVEPSSPLALWRSLVTLGADGAMVGETGTSVDQHLAGKTGLSSRVGFHDFLHLFDAVGRGVMRHRPHNDKSSAAAEGSLSS